MTKPATTVTSQEFDRATGHARRAALQGPVFVTDGGQPSHVLLTHADYEELIADAPGFADPPRCPEPPESANGLRLSDLLSRTEGIGDIDFDPPRLLDLPEPAKLD